LSNYKTLPKKYNEGSLYSYLQKSQFNETQELSTARTASLLNSSNFSDVKVILSDDKKIPAHKSILITRSPYFAQMFRMEMKESKMNQIEFKDTLPEVVKISLEYIYRDHISIDIIHEEFATELLLLAHRFQLPCLMASCEQYISQHLDSSNVISLLQLADSISALGLRNNCIHYISYRFSHIRTTHEYKKLSSELKGELKLNVKSGEWDLGFEASAMEKLKSKFKHWKAVNI